MANTTVPGGNRGVDLWFGQECCNICMAGETELPFSLTQDKGVVTSMGLVAGLALPGDERLVAIGLLLFFDRILMTGQAEFPVGGGVA